MKIGAHRDSPDMFRPEPRHLAQGVQHADPASGPATQCGTREAKHAAFPSGRHVQPAGVITHAANAVISDGIAQLRARDSTVAVALAARSIKLEDGNQTITDKPRPAYHDVTDEFTSKPLHDGGRTYLYADPRTHGLLMKIADDGTLTFDIRATGDRKMPGSGRDMFISGMQRLEKDGVRVKRIVGSWLPDKGDNYTEYMKNCRTMPKEQAAANTWTGRRAAEYGFTVVERVNMLGSGRIRVLFVKRAQDAPAGCRSREPRSGNGP